MDELHTVIELTNVSESLIERVQSMINHTKMNGKYKEKWSKLN